MIQTAQQIPLQQKVDNVQAGFLFVSDDYEVKNWEFDFLRGNTASTGFNDCFCFTFVRNGNFFFDVTSKENDMHTGHLIVEKADIAYKLRPSSGGCTIFNFSGSFYQRLLEDYPLQRSYFFGNKNMLSVVLQTTPVIDYLHHAIYKGASVLGKLEMDTLVFDLTAQVCSMVADVQNDDLTRVAPAANHLAAIERAKHFMAEHFQQDISLQDISRHALVSPFHFSRLFKEITGRSPHQYLTTVRLKHAELLLTNSAAPVKEVGYSSGFMNPDYFSQAFKTKYGQSPAAYRQKAG